MANPHQRRCAPGRCRWFFNSDAFLWRAASGRAAQIGTIGVARCVWWCRWEERRRARSSRAASVLNSAARDGDLGVCHHLGPAGGVMLRWVALGWRAWVLDSLNDADSRLLVQKCA